MKKFSSAKWNGIIKSAKDDRITKITAASVSSNQPRDWVCAHMKHSRVCVCVVACSHTSSLSLLEQPKTFSMQLLHSACSLMLRMAERLTYQHAHTHARTYTNGGCITIIVSYSRSVARSGYRKMPCRQMHYKYDKERGGRTERERAKEGEDKRKKQSEKRAARTRWRRRENTRGMNTISNSSLAICPLPSPLCRWAWQPPAAMSAIKSKFGQLGLMLSTQIRCRSSLSKHRYQQLMIIKKKNKLKHNHSQTSKEPQNHLQLAAKLNCFLRFWNETFLATACCKS